MLDLDPAHGPVDRPSAFEPQHRREYITATAREDVIDSDADTDDLSDGSDSSEDDVVIVEVRRRRFSHPLADVLTSSSPYSRSGLQRTHAHLRKHRRRHPPPPRHRCRRP